MIRVAFLIGCSFAVWNLAISQPSAIPPTVRRIVFLGNSITYDGRYIEVIDTYFAIHYPDWDYEIVNVGLPSETVSGLSEEGHAEGRFPRPDLRERLDRVIDWTDPDLVLTCYGMNDGIYLPFDEKRFRKYKKGIMWLHRELQNSAAQIIHITPPIYDERKDAAYANVLDIYTDWLLSKQYTDGWRVLDIHSPMQGQLEARRLEDSTFAFARDGIHPGDKGHLEIAKQVLLQLGEPDYLSTMSFEDLLARHPRGREIWALVQQRQRLTKDAWLTAIGHKRPNMKVGIGMDEAQEKAAEIAEQIKTLARGID